MKKNFWWGVFWTTLAVFVTDFLIHQVFLKNAYTSTASLWRAEEEMAQVWPAMVMGQVLIGFFIFWIYSIGYKGKGWNEAWRFAIYFGALSAGKNLVMFAVTPYTWGLLWAWIFWGFVQMWVIGMVATWAIKTWKIQAWNWN